MDVDRYATYNNKLLSVYNSFFMEKMSSGIDAFAQDNWNQVVNFVHAPFTIMGRVVNFLDYDAPNAPFVMIAPYWAGSPWYNRLLAMSDKAYILPKENLFLKILDIPCKSYISNPSWEFLVLTRGINILK